MKKSTWKSKLLCISMAVATSLLTSNLYAANKPISKKEAKRWCAKKEWANGFAPVPYKGTDCVEFATQYTKNKELWDKMFSWMAQNDLLNMPEGTYPIDGKRCYIKISNSQTRDAAKAKWSRTASTLICNTWPKGRNVSASSTPKMPHP